MKKLVYLFVIILGSQISATYAAQQGTSPGGASDCNGDRTAKETTEDAPASAEGSDASQVKEDSAVVVDPPSDG